MAPAHTLSSPDLWHLGKDTTGSYLSEQARLAEAAEERPPFDHPIRGPSMSATRWQQLLTEPGELKDDAAFEQWFDDIAGRLLCGCTFLVGSEPHRFTEIEFYYHGGAHLDPFTHRDPIQRHTGLWYFHRTGGIYRGGSFKGFDLTFGGESAFGGVLIRGIEQIEGDLVDGPSLSVDHLLARTEAVDVATLDEAIESRPGWDPDNPLRLLWLDRMEERRLVKCFRVGLSLKKHRKSEPPPRYIMKSYRYLSEPRRISKGKLHMALGLHAQGATPAEIRETTGCTRGALERYIADFEEGKKEADFDSYFGIELGPKELARLYGLWHAMYGQG
jgi:hypothetical protein